MRLCEGENVFSLRSLGLSVFPDNVGAEFVRPRLLLLFLLLLLFFGGSGRFSACWISSGSSISAHRRA